MSSNSIRNTSEHLKPEVLLLANQSRAVLNFRMPVISALIEEGFEVHLLLPKDAGPELDEIRDLSITRLRNFKRNDINPFKNFLLLIELFEVISKRKPALTLLFGVQAISLAAPVARIAGVPAISVLSGLGYAFLNKGPLPALVRSFLRIALHASAKVLTENEQDLMDLQRMGMVPIGKGQRIMGCGLDIRHFQPTHPPEKKNKTVFTFIGRLLRDKGLVEFADSAIQLQREKPNLEFRVIGPPDPENPAAIPLSQIKQWEKSGAVRYLGEFSDIRPWIEDSDWIVLPSYREGLSRVLLESLAMQRPIIASNVPGCTELVIPGQTGIRCEAGNTQSLKQALTKAIELSDDRYLELGKNGRSLVLEKYDAFAVGKQYTDLIKSVLSQQANKQLKHNTI